MCGKALAALRDKPLIITTIQNVLTGPSAPKNLPSCVCGGRADFAAPMVHKESGGGAPTTPAKYGKPPSIIGQETEAAALNVERFAGRSISKIGHRPQEEMRDT